MKFQSPRSGKFVSNEETEESTVADDFMFQSPRSGKFVSNTSKQECLEEGAIEKCFNPLDRGNLYLIRNQNVKKF